MEGGTPSLEPSTPRASGGRVVAAAATPSPQRARPPPLAFIGILVVWSEENSHGMVVVGNFPSFRE